MRIIFLGTPEFAVASLEAIVKDGWPVVAVVTAPDKPAGRGMKIQSSAVKKFAEDHKIPVLQPLKLKDPEFLEQLRSYKADIQIVVAFRMLPEVVWNMPPLGTVNLHASLLPHYRGAAPINWAIINGEKETGVTTFKLQQEIDTGNILLQKKVLIGDDETAGELHDKLKRIGADLLIETINGLSTGSLKEISQNELIKQTIREPAHAPRIFSETCKINWNLPAENIYNLIRGLSPYPSAFTLLDDKIFKIYSAEIIKSDSKEEPGTLISDKKTFLKFAAAGGYISCKEIQLAGKKRMDIEDFLRGYREFDDQ